MNASPRSVFVTSIAWCLIVSAALGAMGGLALTVTHFLLIQREETMTLIQQLRAAQMLQEGTLWLMENMRWLALGFTIAAILGTVAGIGLLKRREWGRRSTIALLLLSLLGMIPAFFIRIDPGLLQVPLSPEIQAQLDLASWTLVVTNALFFAFHAWLAWKLRTPAVRAEFRRDHAPTSAP